MSASEWKDKGNAAFAAKNWDDAIQFYSEAINLDPNNHVLYSNRSAALLSKGDAQQALKNARRCVELNGKWAKGYGRVGAALMALKRYDEAREAYQEGLTVEPNNANLKEGLAEVDAALILAAPDVDAPLTRAAAPTQASGAAGGAAGGSAEGPASASDDPFADDLAALFGEVEQLEEEKQTAVKPPKKVDREVDLGTAEAQIARLLAPSYKWRNLNPFEVLQLALDATDEDVKYRYRRLSALVHPDKCQHPQAADAFQEIKRAFEELQDEERKKVALSHAETARQEAQREYKKQLKKGVSAATLGPLDDFIKVHTMKLFAEVQRNKLNYEKRSKEFQVREMETVIAEETKQLDMLKTEKEWATGREDRVGTWRSYQGDVRDNKRKMLGTKAPKDTIHADDVLQPSKKPAVERIPADEYKKKWR